MWWLLFLVPPALWALLDYESFWFKTQFWLKPDQRRPYTFIMRDIYHQAAPFVISGLGFFFYALGAFWWHLTPEQFLILALGYFSGALVAHLFWGKDWVPGEMPVSKKYSPSSRVLRWSK